MKNPGVTRDNHYKQQEIISLSTTESEYIAATYAAKEALWLAN